MKIKRMLNGVEHEFELTTEELSEAYTQVQHQFDCDDVANVLASMIADGYVDISVEQSELYALVPKMAAKFRRDMDKYCDEWWNFAKEAVTEVLEEKYGSI